MSECSPTSTLPSEEDGQYLLPIEVRATQDVYWYTVVKTIKKRHILRNKVTVDLVIDPDTSLAQSTDIAVDHIDLVKDPDLRYALRLQAATQSAGWYEHAPGHKSKHSVSIDATNQGFDSEFIDATYTGITTGNVDTFIENLRRFAPDYDGDYGQL